MMVEDRLIGTKQIILVEDDEHLQMILALSLSKRGHHVHRARLGSEARRLLALRSANVLILDINLPDETGWDILRWLRRQPGTYPRVIVITAFHLPHTRVNDLAPYGVLTKPFPIEALTHLVEDDADD